MARRAATWPLSPITMRIVQFAGGAPFLSGLPPGIALHHLSSYLLIAALAVIAALIGLPAAARSAR